MDRCDCGCGRKAVIEVRGLAWAWLCAVENGQVITLAEFLRRLRSDLVASQ